MLFEEPRQQPHPHWATFESPACVLPQGGTRRHDECRDSNGNRYSRLRRAHVLVISPNRNDHATRQGSERVRCGTRQVAETRLPETLRVGEAGVAAQHDVLVRCQRSSMTRLDVSPRLFGSAPTLVFVTATEFDRIAVDSSVLGGKPRIRDSRMSVGMLVQMVAAGKSVEQITGEYPYLDGEDVRQALAYSAALAESEYYLPVHPSA